VSNETSEVYHGLMQIVGGKVQARNILVPLRNYLPGMVFYNYAVGGSTSCAEGLSRSGRGPRIEIPDCLVLALIGHAPVALRVCRSRPADERSRRLPCTTICWNAQRASVERTPRAGAC
jgi:hypothetical protein